MNNDKKQAGYFMQDEPKEFKVGYTPVAGVYRIEIDGTIESVGQFSTAIQVLQMAKEEDQVEIYLQTNGGCVDASGAFVHSMRKCAAPIHIIATGGVHSAGTHILLEADSFELAENFNSLLHNGSAGSVGNINEYVAKARFDLDFVTAQYKSVYQGFLTDQEIEGMMRGDNIWLDAAAWMERWEKRNVYLKNKLGITQGSKEMLSDSEELDEIKAWLKNMENEEEDFIDVEKDVPIKAPKKSKKNKIPKEL